MITPPERSAERDAAIIAMLPHVQDTGWSVASLQAGAGMNADLLFPGGVTDMIEAYCDLADRWMEQAAASWDMTGLRLPGRVRAIIAIRLTQNRPYRNAIRRALGILAAPGHARLSARCLARTVDTIWHAAGDNSADFSWYTKRAILAGVYGKTLLHWLGAGSEDDEATLAFLDRLLSLVGRIGKARGNAASLMGRFRPAA